MRLCCSTLSVLCYVLFSVIILLCFPSTALVGREEEHLACKRWGVGVVISLERVQIVCIWSSWCHCIPKPYLLNQWRRQGGEGEASPLWVDVQKLCNMCVLSLSWNFCVSHDKYIARPSSKEPRWYTDNTTGTGGLRTLDPLYWPIPHFPPVTKSWRRHCFKSRLVFPLWYRLTRVVLEKRPLNGCSSSCVVVICHAVGIGLLSVNGHSSIEHGRLVLFDFFLLLVLEKNF